MTRLTPKPPIRHHRRPRTGASARPCRARVRRRLAAALAPVATALVCAAPALAGPPTYVDPTNSPPRAAFTAAPQGPYTGDKITLTSYSSDEEGPLAAQRWDLDGDGRFDDASGPVASVTFNTPGPHTVSLRVTDRRGASNIQFQIIDVRPRSSPPSLMSPFPVVRIAGRLTSRGARITLLSVRGPRRAKVVLRCKGRKCPYKRTTARIKRRRVDFKRMRRELRAGTIIRIFVSQRGKIGKYTRFRIRRGKVPARIDRCLEPGATKASRCPGA
jgi:PKD domain